MIAKSKRKIILEKLVDISFEAGEILLKYQKKRHELRIQDKGTDGIATEADSASESFIVDQLKHIDKSYAFLSEENCQDIKFAKKMVTENTYCWVIDPLDGTNNFVNGIPIYAISISLVFCNEPIIGIVYNPLSGECFYAAKDLGAFFIDFRVNPLKKFQLSNKKNNKEAKDCIFSPSPSYEKKNKFVGQLDSFKKNITGARALRRLGSAALEICYVANGNFDGYWEKGLKPWDTAAALIICLESNIKVTDFYGRDYDIFSESIIAAGEGVYSRILGTLKS